MNQSFRRFVSRLLIASLVWLPLQARAELIGTHQMVAASAEQAPAARTALAGKLEAYGVASDAARSRVAALTDAEAISLADRVGEAPAGAFAAWGVLIVLAFLVWRFVISDQAQAEGKK